MWNGTDGVVVETCHASNTGYTYNASTYWTTTLTGPETKTRYFYQDNVTACQNSGNLGTSTTTRPNIRFEWLGSPCSTTPGTNTILPLTYSTCPGLPNPTLTIVNTYTNAGIYYQWQSSTVSAVGPFVPVPGATLSSAPLPTLGVTTWYQLVVGCVNASTIAIPGTQMYVAGPTINTVPYYESFEGIQGNNRLPNCSWFAANIATTVLTYTASNTDNRVPRTGSNFLTYALPSTNNYVFSNGIQMEPNITYSAALYYATEYFGYSNWTSLSMYVSAGQSTTNLIPIASVSPAVSGSYKLLDGLFTVPTSGVYNLVFKATGTNGNALYLNIDDISVTIPCTPSSMNNPSVTLSIGGSTSVCSGDALSLTAIGADAFSWNTGASGPSITPVAIKTITYTVIGTNTLTQCTDAKSMVIDVRPSPTVFIVSDKDAVCSGDIVYLTAYGASNYQWNNGPGTSLYAVSPKTSGGYTVSGTNQYNCASSASKNITVHALPTVTAATLNNEICVNEVATLVGSGAVTYQWLSSSSSALMAGGTIYVSPNVSSTYTVIGTDANGCKNMYTVNQTVNTCVGIDKHSALANGLRVFPNPAQSVLNIEYSSVISHVELIDLTGRVVKSESPASEKVEINMSQLSNGVYYAKITTGDVTEVIKVVKQ